MPTPANLLLGVSVEGHETFGRLHQLYYINHPDRLCFVSFEPLISMIPLAMVFDMPRSAGWVIVGGESGPKARPCNIEWIRSVVAQCAEAGVPCFVKQLGANSVTDNTNLYDFPDFTQFDTVAWGAGTATGAAVILDDSKGGDTSEWPPEFQVQQYPTVSA